MKKPAWRDQYDEDEDLYVHDLTKSHPEGISLTEQSHKDDVDLNLMLNRMGVKDGSRIPADISVTDPRYYGEVEDYMDLRTALDRTREAQERFNQLPAKIKNRFDNDPAKLWDFVQNPKNDDEAVEMGLLVRPTKATTTAALTESIAETNTNTST